eukprot:Skav235214  [mRNA]  locus=scaffold3995:25992:31942:+ [translate_table: standard]
MNIGCLLAGILAISGARWGLLRRISHIDTGEQRRALYPLDVPLNKGSREAMGDQGGAAHLGSKAMEHHGTNHMDSGCKVRLCSYGRKSDVELHVEVENRSRRALSLSFGSFTAGSSSSCILAASLQSRHTDGTWRSACVLQPRGYAKQHTALFVPAFQGVKMRILGKVVNLGRFGGYALRVGGDAPNAAEVLLPLAAVASLQEGQEQQLLKPQLRFTISKPQKTLQENRKPVWIGPYEALQPRRYSMLESEIISEVCELTICDADHKLAPRMQTRRLQAFQHSLSPELPLPRHHDVDAKPSSEFETVRRSTFSGFRSARLQLRNRPNTVPALADIPACELPSSTRNSPKPPRSPLPSLRNLGRSQDVLADPVLLELAEAASGSKSCTMALTGQCFWGRLGQRFADAMRSLGYKVLLGDASLVSWVSAHEDSNEIAKLVLVAHWKCLQSCIGILRSHELRKAVVLCDHCDEASARAEAKTLPCSWQVVMNASDLQLKRLMTKLKDGTEVFYQSIKPKDKVVKHVCIFLHGYMGSSDLFLHFAAEWARRGALVLCPDLPGHGRSDGLLTYIPDWWAWVDTIWESVDLMIKEAGKGEVTGELPIFISGASLGGGLAVCAVLLCPMLTVSDEASSHALAQAGQVPRRELGFTYPDWLDERMSEMQTPFIIAHGAADKVTDPETSKRLYEESVAKDKDLKLYPDVHHAELFSCMAGSYEDVDWTSEELAATKACLEDTAAWMSARSS